MKLLWEPCPRIPSWDKPVPWVVAGWVVLMLASVLLERGVQGSLGTCLILRVTGHPCPTCGSTRSVLALLSFDWKAAFTFNPLVSVGLPIVAVLAVLRLGMGRCLRLEVGASARRCLFWGFLAVLLANWLWVLRTL